jgi:hypothetical protein
MHGGGPELTPVVDSPKLEAEILNGRRRHLYHARLTRPGPACLKPPKPAAGFLHDDGGLTVVLEAPKERAATVLVVTGDGDERRSA